MKKRVFKYKLVYWSAILVNLITLFIFGFASFNRIFAKAFSDFRGILFSLTTFAIAFTSVLSMFRLLIKSSNAVKTFSVMLVLLLFTFSLGILDSMTFKKDFDYDAITFSLIFFLYGITVMILFFARKFKSRDDFRMLEINRIGTKEN